MGIQAGEGMEWETSVRRGKSADADAGGSRRGACVSSRTQYTYKHTHAYVCICLTARGRTTHTIYQHALEVSVCVCVCGGLRPFGLSAVAFVTFEEKF